MNKRLLTIGIVGLAALAIIGISLLSSRQSGYPINTARATPPGLANAVRYDDSSLVFSNGRAFVQYSYDTGRSQLLSADSPVNGLQPIDSLAVSSDHKYLVFHLVAAIPGSEPYSALQQHQLATGPDYWWVYDISSRTFTPLPQNTLLAKPDGDNILALSYSGSDESITTYSAGDLQPTASLKITPSSNFFATQDGYLLQTTDNKVLYTTDGVVNQTLFTGTVLLGVTPDKQTAVAVTGEDDNRQLVRITLADKSQHVIASNLTSSPALASDGTVLFAVSTSGNDKVSTYNAVSHTELAWNLTGGAKNLAHESLKLQAALSSQAALVSDENSKSYLVGNNLTDIKTGEAGFSEGVATGGESALVRYDSASNTMVISSGSGQISPAELQAINQRLKSNGYNPDLLSYTYQPLAN